MISQENFQFYLRYLVKVGIQSKNIQIEYFNNFAKGRKWNPEYPPKEPKRAHGCAYLNIEGEEFLSEPTWGSGTINEEGKFTFSYKKSYFLKNIISHNENIFNFHMRILFH